MRAITSREGWRGGTDQTTIMSKQFIKALYTPDRAQPTPDRLGYCKNLRPHVSGDTAGFSWIRTAQCSSDGRAGYDLLLSKTEEAR